MELFATHSGSIFYCHNHNMFSVHYTCVSLSFYSNGLKKLLTELKKVRSCIREGQKISMNISSKGAYLHLTKREVEELVYLVEGALCAFHALEIVSA